jgi:hypothetical protein
MFALRMDQPSSHLTIQVYHAVGSDPSKKRAYAKATPERARDRERTRFAGLFSLLGQGFDSNVHRVSDQSWRRHTPELLAADIGRE